MDIAQLDYIYDWMDDLLEKDEGIYVCTQSMSNLGGSWLNQKLCIALHVPSKVERGKADEAWNSKHGRVFKVFSPIHVKEVVPTKFWADEGRSLIAGRSFTSLLEGFTSWVIFIQFLPIKRLSAEFLSQFVTKWLALYISWIFHSTLPTIKKHNTLKLRI